MYPVLFRVGSIPIYSYGVMLALAFFVGWLILMVRTQPNDRRWATGIFLVAGGAALIGARVLYVAVNWSRYESVGEALSLKEGGGVAYGGFVAGFIAAWIATRNRSNNIETNQWIVAATPALLIGLAITRVGCFLNGCDWGKPTGAAWAVRFPFKSPAFSAQRFSGLLGPEATSSLPVHPTQLYEIALALLLLTAWFAVPESAARRWGRFKLAVVGYATGRFLIEILRDEPGRGSLVGLSTSQWTAIGTAALALYSCWRGDLREKRASV